MKREVKKPTGLTGLTWLSFETASADFRRLQFPSAKDEVETLVAQDFIAAANQQSILNYSVTSYEKNPTDDYDFTLDTSAGRRYLELLEVAPESLMKSGYQEAPGTYRTKELAQALLGSIESKSRKYDSVTAAHTLLLLYETQWTFAGDEVALLSLQHGTYRMAPKFEEIYWYHPISPGDGIIEFVYPTPSDYWQTFDPECYREIVTTALDPAGWTMERK